MTIDNNIYSVPEYVYNSTNLINPRLEIYRVVQLKKLIKTIYDKIKNPNPIIKSKIKSLLLGLFIACNLEKISNSDGIIQIDDGIFSKASATQLGIFNQMFKKEIGEDIKIDINLHINNILKSITNYAAKIAGKTNEIYTFAKNTYTINLPSVTKKIAVNDDILAAAKNRYTGPAEQFQRYLLCAVLRYKAFGVDTIFDPGVIASLQKMDLNFICFGNLFSTTQDYCGLFYDIEKYFASRGLYMPMDIEAGFYLINPYNNNFILDTVYHKIKIWLQSKKSVAFILNLPKQVDNNKIMDDKLYSIMKTQYSFMIHPLTNQKTLIVPRMIYLFYNKTFQEENKQHDFGQIVNSFANYHSQFPARNKLYDNDYKITIFKKLVNMDLKEYTTEKKAVYKLVRLNNIDYLYQGRYHYIIIDPTQYKYYMLSDLFNDECRMLCSFENKISPYDYYNKNKDLLIEKMVQRGITIDPYTLREQIYRSTMECSTHNPLIIKYFIKKFRAKNILDFSAGWGDRLLGALSSDINLYIGVDPNECLHPNYQKMITLLKPLSPNPKGTFKMVLSPFEKYDLPKNVIFDLVYTSPPYFDYESYTTAGSQSMQGYRTESAWLTNFLYVAIEKCMASLRNGGHIVLYISQAQNRSYVEKFMTWAKRLPGLYYLGNIFKAQPDLTKLHPIFIFEKNTSIPRILYNPEIVVDTIKYNNNRLNIIRDDLLTGGTKTRASVDYLEELLSKNRNKTELVYTGATNGYGQVAIAYSLYLLKSNVKLRIYYQDVDLPYTQKIRDLVSYLYPATVYIKTNKPMRDIWAMINDYIAANKNAMEIPFGLGDDRFKHYLRTNLGERIQPLVNKIKRLWLVGGSGTLFDVLYGLLPNTQFNIVQVGKKITLGQDRSTRTKLYVSKYSLYENINIPVYYPTVPSYDGKIWEFTNEFLDGDYIWNVAGIHNKL